jgi:hypothetical protein
MQSWLSRLSFSFLIVGMILAWHAYRAAGGRPGPIPTWKIILELIAAALCFVLGFMGIRQRHRP